MELRTDLDATHVVAIDALDWVPSPSPGVDRRMLERIGDEVARATTVVRYAPGSAFPTHVHGGGEEFLVLDGMFVDEHGAYPAGTYVRNPVGSAHAPSAPDGCTILVKLRQMDPAAPRVVADAGELYAAGGVRVALESVEGALQVEDFEGLVLSGRGTFDGQPFEGRTWLRARRAVLVADGPVRLWSKRGALGAEPGAV